MRKRMLPLVLALLTLAGCGMGKSQDKDTEHPYEIYFVAENDESGAAVGGEFWHAQGKEPLIQELLARLLAGPETKERNSPFPKGLEVRSWELNDGKLDLDFSEAYEGLSGIDLTLANYCLALTLCQVEGVDSIHVTIEGEQNPLTTGENLRPEDVILLGTEGEPMEMTATLWFPRADGTGLGVEYRRLLLTEEDTLSAVVMEALIQGPSYDTMTPVLPAETELLGVIVEDGVCYVNLPADVLEALAQDEEQLRLTVYAIVNTMAGNVDTVRTVQLRADGQPAQLPNGLNQALKPDLSLEK